jgi:molybdate/tungstate transport system substrate-binding protein
MDRHFKDAMMILKVSPALLVLAIALLASCSRRSGDASAAPAPTDTLDVYVASSLDGAVGRVLDQYAARQHAVVRRESGASIELARRITELHRVPDLLVLADAEVFPRLLVPRYAPWYLELATDHMVVAFTERSRFATLVDSANWMDVVRRPGVEVGRADASVAPVGYRTLLMFQLAQAHYSRPGLADSLLAAAPPRNVRGNASALAALLGTGDLDYVYDYRSVAQAKGFRYVALPAAIDLGDPARGAAYGRARVTIAAGASDSTTIDGAVIASGVTIPRDAPHANAALAFLSYMLTPAARATFAAAHMELLPLPRFVGTDTPAVVRRMAGANR